MSSKLQLVSVMVLAAFLAGCGSTKTGSIDPGGNGGNNGGQNGNGGDNGDGGNGGDNGDGGNGGDGGDGGNGGDNGDGGNGGDGAQTRTFNFRNGYRLVGPIVDTTTNDAEFDVEVEVAEDGAISGVKTVDGSSGGTWQAQPNPLGDSRRNFSNSDRFLQLDVADNYQIGGYVDGSTASVGIAGTRSTGNLDFNQQVGAGGKYEKAEGFKGAAVAGGDVVDVVGDVRMDVEWAGTGWKTSGEITGIRVEENPGVNATMVLEESNTFLDAASTYSGAVTLTVNGQQSSDSANRYQGGFYGDNAASTAGVLRARGSAGGEDITIIGGFGAERQ